MPSLTLTPRAALEAIDARHEELIHKLDELNAQIEAALAEFATRRDVEESAAETPVPKHRPRKAA